MIPSGQLRAITIRKGKVICYDHSGVAIEDRNSRTVHVADQAVN